MGIRQFITFINACDVFTFPYNPPRSWLDRRRLYIEYFGTSILKGEESPGFKGQGAR